MHFEYFKYTKLSLTQTAFFFFALVLSNIEGRLACFAMIKKKKVLETFEIHCELYLKPLFLHLLK